MSKSMQAMDEIIFATTLQIMVVIMVIIRYLLCKNNIVHNLVV